MTAARARRSFPRDRTVLALARDVERRLRRARVAFGHGTANAWDEAVYLVLHALGLPLDDLTSVAKRPVSATQQAAIIRLLAARTGERLPAAYLTREAWLGEHRFYIDRRVLVPRSFIAEILREPSPLLPPLGGVRSVLDLCTGSGCLAILAALACPGATVDAADLSAPALAVAKRNVAAYRLGRRVRLARSDLFAALAGRRYDLILSNPPYVTDAVMHRLPPEYRHEPALALAGGRDGLDLVRRIIAAAADHLTTHGVLVLEVGHARGRVEKAIPALEAWWPQTSGGDDCVLVANRASIIRAMKADASIIRAMKPKAGVSGAVQSGVALPRAARTPRPAAAAPARPASRRALKPARASARKPGRA